MALTIPTAAEVKMIILLSPTPADAAIDLMIAQAEEFVSQCPGVVAAGPITQKAIVMWVAAHFLSGSYGQAGPKINEALGDASKGFSAGVRIYGDGLMSTMYGAQAVLLDTSGCLRRLGMTRPKLQVL